MTQDRGDFLHFTETAAQDQFERFTTFDLADPSIIDSVEITPLSQDRLPLEKMRQALNQATQIIVCNTDSGLGDFVMSLRAIETVGFLYPGKVVCIPPDSIKELLQPGNTQYVDSVDTDKPGTVILNLGIETRFSHSQTRLAEALHTDTKRISDILTMIEHSTYTIPLELQSVTDYAEGLEQKGERTHSVSDQYFFAIFKALGFTGTDITLYMKAPLQEVPLLAESYDICLIPDAGHFPIENGYRSEKSPNLDYWDEFFFNAMTNGYKKIAISMGMSHAEYCDDIATNAEMRGFSVTRVDGTLKDILQTALSSRVVVTSDNGPAHLINEALLNTQAPNKVELMLELFSNHRVGSDRFAIRGLGEKGIVAEYKSLA